MYKLFTLALICLIFYQPLVSASCNIDSAGLNTYSSSDGQVITKVGVVATFRLGCSRGTEEPRLYAETAEGQKLTITSSLDRPEFKELSFVEELKDSKSRWIEIKIFDESTRQLMKTISVSHYGVYGGPFLKMETVATLSLIGLFIFAQTIRNKLVN